MRHPRDRSRRRYSGAKIRIGLDTTGWMRKSKRLKKVVNDLPKIRLGYEGDHPVLNQANSSIAKHAVAHGDDIWMFSDETKLAMGTELRNGLVRVARNQQRNCDAEMQELADMAREEIYLNILDGKIDGPERTPEWNAYKAQKWPGPTPNMVASGVWLDSLTAELVPR